MTHILYIIITIFLFFPFSLCEEEHDPFSDCVTPYPFKCGSNLLNISYPFWGGDRPEYCSGGHGLKIECVNHSEYHFFVLEGKKFRVLNISEPHHTMIIAKEDIWFDICRGVVLEKTLESSPFKITSNSEFVRNIIFYHDCDDTNFSWKPNYFSCYPFNEKTQGFFTVDGWQHQLENLTNTCKAEIRVPVLLSALYGRSGLSSDQLVEVLSKGFEVEYDVENKSCWDCTSSGGACGSTGQQQQFSCFCDGHKTPCPPPPSQAGMLCVAYLY